MTEVALSTGTIMQAAEDFLAVVNDGSGVRNLRKAHGITQRRLAKAASLHVNSIHRLERFEILPETSWYSVGLVGLALREIASAGISPQGARARPIWGVTADTVSSRQKRECGARTRKGTPCRAKAFANGRCKFHGGLSTGPRTAEGRERIRQAQLRRWARWRVARDKVTMPFSTGSVTDPGSGYQFPPPARRRDRLPGLS